MESSDEKIYIHAGTQNGAILGFHGTLKVMESLYAYSPNLGAVKCMNTNGRYLVTGGVDEIIRLYDLKQKKEKGQLLGHEGTITCIRSYKNFVITGAEDCSIIIWKVKEWSLLHRLKGHKEAVYDMALHDSGKILASVGKDKKVILWNLINGTKIFRKTMTFIIKSKDTYKIKWAPDENVVIMSDFTVVLVSQETNKSIKELKHPKRVNDFLIIDNVVVVAGDDGNLYFWNNLFNAESESFYLAFKAHTPRVKKVISLVIGGVQHLVTCSTDGTICFWDITDFLKNMEFVNENKVLEEDLKPVYSLNSYQRIITLDVHFESQVFSNDPHSNASEMVGDHANQKNEDDEEVEQEKLEGKKKKNKNKNKNEGGNENKKNKEVPKVGKKIKKVTFEEAKPAANKKLMNLRKQELPPNQRKHMHPKGNQKNKQRKPIQGKLQVEYD